MVEVKEIIKSARHCHSKQSWEGFFQAYHSDIAASTDPKLSSEIFLSLRQDPQALLYNSKILDLLMGSCASTFNYELGKKICAYGHRVSSPHFILSAAHFLIESSEGALARSLLLRALRSRSLPHPLRAALCAQIAASYAGENKRAKASLWIERAISSLRAGESGPLEWAHIQAHLGRILFRLGYYEEAVPHLQGAAEQFGVLMQIAPQGEALFYWALSLERRGADFMAISNSLRQQSRELSANHGIIALQSLLAEYDGDQLAALGHYHEAHLQYRIALEPQRKAPQNYHRFIILIKIILGLFASGRRQLALKQGGMLLAAIKNSKNQLLVHYRSRLAAQMAWEQGQLSSSQKILFHYLGSLPEPTLLCHHEIELYLTYLFQSAMLGEEKIEHKIPRPRELPPGLALTFWLQLVEANFAINQGAAAQAEKILKSLLTQDDFRRWLPCVVHALDTLIRIKLQRHQLDRELETFIAQLKEVLGEFTSTPLRALLELAYAAVAYQSGNFPLCIKHLSLTGKLLPAPSPYHGALSYWLATTTGRPYGTIPAEMLAPLARLTRHYFAPSLEIAENSSYIISAHYRVSLASHPSLQALMKHLLQQPHFDGSLGDFQTSVWQQSLTSAGWRHKIRNSLIRLRRLFPYTVAPLFLSAHTIRLFIEAAPIGFPRIDAGQRQEEISRLLANSAMTSSQLRTHLAISTATTKRLLAHMIIKGIIKKEKRGRGYEYSLLDR